MMTGNVAGRLPQTRPPSEGRWAERRGEGLISNAAEQEVTCGYALTESHLCFAVKPEDFHGSGSRNAAASATSQKPLWKLEQVGFHFHSLDLPSETG